MTQLSTRRFAASLLGLGTVLALAGCGSSQATPDWARQSAVPAGHSSATASPSATATVTATAVAKASGSGTSVQQPAANDVQTALQAMNYDVSITGTYDAQTISAIKRFQAKHHLPATGIVDGTTQQEMLTAAATFTPSAAATVDSDGLTFDGIWWSSGSFYRSKDRQCVVYEKQWQDAVAAGVKSTSVTAHDQAAALGCQPDVWTPNGITHEKVAESHTDGQSCSSSQAGEIATGNYPWAICNQVKDGVWRWKVMAN